MLDEMGSGKEIRMSGYVWARTEAGELFIVLVVDGEGYVPGRENAIEPEQFALFELLEPVKWPTAITPRNRNSVQPSSGALAPDAIAASVTQLYAESA